MRSIMAEIQLRPIADRQPEMRLVIGSSRIFVGTAGCSTFLRSWIAVRFPVPSGSQWKHRDARAMTSSPEAAQLDSRWSGLMAAAQAGDRASYERLLRDCTPLVRSVVRRQGVRVDRVDDVVQDVLLTVHRARMTYDPERSFSAWLCTIAQRRAIDALRSGGRRDSREIFSPLAYENHADTEHDHAASMDAGGHRLKEMVEQLPPGQREAIEVLALRQLSLDEAAGMTGKTTGALKVNMHRALKTLRARFGGTQ